jgi:hypothetical protein
MKHVLKISKNSQKRIMYEFGNNKIESQIKK